ncbi:HEPN domain-containing protein [Acetobacter pasteurianus]
MVDSESRLRSILDEFEISCDRLETIIDYINGNGPPDGQLRITMFNNMVVALTATIEEVIRSIFSEYLLVLQEGVADHRRLPRSLQNANLDASISLLKKLKKDDEIDRRANLALNFEKCVKGKPHYHLIWEEITYNEGNCRTTQITDIAKRSGISEILKKICDCQELEDWTAQSHLDTRVTTLTTRWNEIFDERDLVVHRISNATGWGAEKIKQSISLVRIVMRRIMTSLKENAEQLLTIEERRGGQ